MERCREQHKQAIENLVLKARDMLHTVNVFHCLSARTVVLHYDSVRSTNEWPSWNTMKRVRGTKCCCLWNRKCDYLFGVVVKTCCYCSSRRWLRLRPMKVNF